MNRCFAIVSAVLVAAASVGLPALGQVSTGFTYQAQLKSFGSPVNSTADFQLRLFTAPTSGTQIGQPVELLNQVLINGVFTVPNLDFGAGAFTDQGRFLEIAVRAPAGTGSFVTLTPRQALIATPYALKVPGVDGHSLNAADGSPSDVVFVDNDGEVGIGTTDPQGPLDVRSGNGSYVRIDGVNGDLHMNGGTDKVSGIYNDNLGGGNPRTDFIVNGQPQMAVKIGGVGIGTTSPAYRLHVVDDQLWTARFENSHPVAAAVEFVNTSSGATWELGVAGPQIPFGIQPGSMYFYRPNATGDVAMTIAPNDWVGLGVTNPAFRLELPNIASTDGRARANQWVTFSSARWKENVQTLEGALDKVKQLRGVSFDWKPEHGGKHDIGFVAEEVGKVVPELVTWEKDGKWAQGLAYDRITALAVEAIKEQEQHLRSLEQENTDLRQQVADLIGEMRGGAAAASR